MTMAPDPTARPVRPGLSLYANLLDPSTSQDSTPATISRAPVVFKQPAEGTTSQDRVGAEKQQINSGRYEPAQGDHICPISVGSLFSCA